MAGPAVSVGDVIRFTLFTWDSREDNENIAAEPFDAIVAEKDGSDMGSVRLLFPLTETVKNHLLGRDVKEQEWQEYVSDWAFNVNDKWEKAPPEEWTDETCVEVAKFKLGFI